MGSDPAAAAWHLRHRGEEASFRSQARAVLDRLPEGPGRVLDLGCGTGPLAPEVRGLGLGWIGLDRDPAMAAGARSRLAPDPAAAAVGAAERLPFPDRTFAAVVALGLFEYLPDPEAALAEIRRVLVPGGAALLAVPRRDSPFRRGLAAVAPLLRALGRRDPFDLRAGRAVGAADACRWAAAAGLGVAEVRAVAPAIVPWPLDRLVPRLAAALASRLPERFGTIRLFTFHRIA
jgi:SAM-dependent methyltransferase